MIDEYIPPQNLDAERAVIGGVLIEPEAFYELPPELKPECFYSPKNGQIFKAMQALSEKQEPIDPVSVAEVLHNRGQVPPVTVSDLMDIRANGMPQAICFHANAVIQAYKQRKAINALRAACQQACETPEDYEQIISQLVISDGEPPRAVHIREVMVATIKRLEKAESRSMLIPTGFTDLDKEIGGIEKGELVVIGGRPSMGKTSLGVDICMNAAEKDFKVMFVSVETTLDKLGIRILSRETKINSRKMRVVSLDDGELKRLMDASGEISELPVHALDRERGWPEITRQIHKVKRLGLDLVILDYLTLLHIPVSRNERRDVAVGRIANEAKALALSLDLGFVLLSQLNRRTEDRGDPEPNMSDLRESGEIEQAADIILFPFRPVVYNPDFRPRDQAFLKVGKARDLPTGKIPVRFNAEITSFEDWNEF